MTSTASSDSDAARAANGAAVRRYCDAWRRGDLATIVDCYADDVVVHWFGRNALAGTHRGKPAVLAALGALQQRANRRLVEIHDVLASDEHAVVLAREEFERDGRRLESRRVLVYHVRDGKLAEAWVYDDDQRAVDEMLA
jgi:ketosteroid isomerase-like protein